MNSNPHMSFSGYISGTWCGVPACGCPGCAQQIGPGGYFIPDRNIVITRVTGTMRSAIDPSCTSPAQVSISGIQGQPDINVVAPTGVLFIDSGPLAVSATAGSSLQIWVGVATSGCNIGSSGGDDGFINVQYVMG